MNLNKLNIRKQMEFYKPMPLWYKERKFVDEESFENYKMQKWKLFKNSNRYIEYIKRKLVYEINLTNRFINKYNICMMILKKISTSSNVSQYMFVDNTMSYLI